MKKKLIVSLLISTFLLGSFSLIGCDNNKESAAKNTETTTEASLDNADTSNTDKDSSKKSDESKSNTTDKSQTKSETTSEKKSESKKNTENVSKKESDKTDSKSKTSNLKHSSNDSKNNTENKSLEELASLIIAKAGLGDLNVTPVQAVNSAKDSTYKKVTNSDLFFCSEGNFNPKALQGGVIVNYLGNSDGGKQFKLIDYDAFKAGGSGTVEHGIAYPNGKIVFK